jgi:hypothetical protein
MATPEPANLGNQELKPLDYTEPVCWCESTGRYTNPAGQEIELRVRGTNVEEVKKYMTTVRISFEVLPEGTETPPEPKSSKGEARYKARIDEEFKKLELHPELDLEIDMDVINTQGIELPYDLTVVIDPDIAGGATHTYKTKKKAKKCSVTLTASDNGVYGVLSGSGIDQATGQADTYPPDPPKKKARFSRETDAPIDFYFRVTGLLASNSYTYNSSSKMVKV